MVTVTVMVMVRVTVLVWVWVRVKVRNLQDSANDVEGQVGAGVAHMRGVVHGGAADVPGDCNRGSRRGGQVNAIERRGIRVPFLELPGVSVVDGDKG